MKSDVAIAALSALANEHRLAAFRHLVERGQQGSAAGQIAEALNLPASSLSFHLSHLVRAGLAVQRRAGRSIVYSANYAAMNGLVAYLTENCCGGADCSGGAAFAKNAAPTAA